MVQQVSYLVKASIRSRFGKQLKVWYRNLFEQSGEASFIPVHHIFAKFARTLYEI